MKKYNFFLSMVSISLLFLVGSLHAQTQKGTIYIGASAGLGSAFGEATGENNTLSFGISSSRGRKVSKFGLSPHIGYFLQNNLMAGLNLRIQISSYDAYAAHSVSVGPALRWYGGVGKYRATMEASVLVGSSKENNKKSSHLGFSGGPGIAWMLNEWMSFDLQALAEYDSRKPKDRDERFATHRFGFRVGIGLFL